MTDPRERDNSRVSEPHPDSVIRTSDGRVVPLKVHRCLWSGVHVENSLSAIAECLHANVARAEIDLQPLRDSDFLVLHDATLDAMTTGSGRAADLTRQAAAVLRLRSAGHVTDERPPLLSEVVRLMCELPSTTRIELDLGIVTPLLWPRVEELVRLIAPVRDRVLLNGYDWNMRRLLQIDPELPVAFDLLPHLDWLSEDGPQRTLVGGKRDAYGYFDTHPLARKQLELVRDYLADRLDILTRLVQGAREIHIRVELFERMLDDGLDPALFRERGLAVDAWTLNAGAPRWQERLVRLLRVGVDVISSDTARELACAARDLAV